jgi:hypothetical protein
MDSDVHTSVFTGFMPVSMYPGHMSFHAEHSQASNISSRTKKDPNNKILTYRGIMEICDQIAAETSQTLSSPQREANK